MPNTIPDNNYSTLAQIQNKVRKITRSISPNVLSDADINTYINQFVLYDMGATLRLFPLKTNLTFYTKPYIDTYSTNTTDVNDPLYNFNNIYYSVHPPVYIAGYQQQLSQSQAEFYTYYPKISSINLLAVGNGALATYAGFIPSLTPAPPPPPSIAARVPFLQNNVLFESLDINNNALALVDVPSTNPLYASTWGYLVVPNNPVSPANLLLPPFMTNNFINYITGQFLITFATPPLLGARVNAQVYPYIPALPQSVLYFNDSFILRPVPDQPYPVQIEVYMRPSELLAGQQPQLAQWAQFIAYGASKKVFEDRMDMDSIQSIMPEFHKQELFVLRTTIMQLSNQRTPTIYTQEKSWNGGNGFWPGSDGFGY